MKKLLLIALVAAGCGEKTVTCKVVGHETASDKYGAISYYTIASCSNGSIRSFCGLSYYVMPIGSHFTETYYTAHFK